MSVRKSGGTSNISTGNNSLSSTSNTNGPNKLSDILALEYLDYHSCQEIFEKHPLGDKLVSVVVEACFISDRETSIGALPSVFLEEYRKVYKQRNFDDTITEAMKFSRIYGVSLVVVFTEGDNYSADKNTQKDFREMLKTPLEETITGEYFINVYEPINFTLIAENDIWSKNFRKINIQLGENNGVQGNVGVGGITIHPSRCRVVSNTLNLYAKYPSSGMGKNVGVSIFERAKIPLLEHYECMLGGIRFLQALGMRIFKKNKQNQDLTSASMRVEQDQKDIINAATTDDTLVIDTAEDVSTFSLNGQGDLSGIRQDAINDCALASDIPAILLSDKGFATVMAEGTEDAKAAMQSVKNYMNKRRDLFDFFDKLAQNEAWTDIFLEEELNKLKSDPTTAEEFAEYTTSSLRRELVDKFTWEVPNLMPENKGEELDYKKSVVDLIKSAQELPGMDTVLTKEWTITEMNTKNLFDTPLEDKPTEEIQEPEPVDEMPTPGEDQEQTLEDKEESEAYEDSNPEDNH